MTTRVGIDGFGRVGRQALKELLDHHADTVEVVGINDLFDTATNALEGQKTRSAQEPARA